MYSDVEITSEVTGVAPEPYLNIGVRQDGILIGKHYIFYLLYLQADEYESSLFY